MNGLYDYLVLQMKSNQFFSAAMFTSALVSIGMVVKTYALSGWLLIRRKYIYSMTFNNSCEIDMYFEEWFREKYKKSYRSFLLEQNRDWKPSLKMGPDVFYVWYKKWPVSVSKSIEYYNSKFGYSNRTSDIAKEIYVVSVWFRGSVLMSIIDEINIIQAKNKKEHMHSYYNSVSDWNMIGVAVEKSIGSIAMSAALRSKIIYDINLFKERKDWYKARNITYKRSYIIDGPPGTGKTSLANAMAHEFNASCVNYMQLSKDMTDSVLIKLFAHIQGNSVLVIEDVDCFFREQDTAFSFSTLLNCLDGSMCQENTIVIMTTNHYDRLDSALVRPGRVDMRISLPLAGEAIIVPYVKKFFGEEGTAESNIAPNVELSMATVQELCISSGSVEETLNKIKTYERAESI